jgi:hypothetical protein
MNGQSMSRQGAKQMKRSAARMTAEKNEQSTNRPNPTISISGFPHRFKTMSLKNGKVIRHRDS